MDRGVRFLLMGALAVTWAVFVALRRVIRAAYQRTQMLEGADVDAMMQESLFRELENEAAAPEDTARIMADEIRRALERSPRGELTISMVDKAFDLLGHGGRALAMLIKLKAVTVQGEVIRLAHPVPGNGGNAEVEA